VRATECGEAVTNTEPVQSADIAILCTGGLIHLLLVVAVIVIVFQFISGRRSG